MVQGTNFPPISQEKGAKKNVRFCNQLIYNNFIFYFVRIKKSLLISSANVGFQSCRNKKNAGRVHSMKKIFHFTEVLP